MKKKQEKKGRGESVESRGEITMCMTAGAWRRGNRGKRSAGGQTKKR